ncbi:MAG: hypothetical protein IIC01_07995 [Planctomycetes bacterium]|nr:hypothetical protein [Planctomycetota bacterium]
MLTERSDSRRFLRLRQNEGVKSVCFSIPVDDLFPSRYLWSPMGDFTPYQKKTIQRYYDQRGRIMLARLQELVTDLYLAETEAKCKQLWSRVEKAMSTLKVSPRLKEHILTTRKVEVLARNVRDWLKAADSET